MRAEQVFIVSEGTIENPLFFFLLLLLVEEGACLVVARRERAQLCRVP